MTTKAQERQQEKDEAIARLRELFPPGSEARTILRHVSSSGMTRWISVVAQDEDGISDVDWLVARALGEKVDNKHGGIKVGGCGMDMGFKLVYDLSSTLYPDGFDCIGAGDDHWHGRCPSNDHSNGDRDFSPHHHKSGGYAVSTRWL